MVTLPLAVSLPEGEEEGDLSVCGLSRTHSPCVTWRQPFLPAAPEESPRVQRKQASAWARSTPGDGECQGRGAPRVLSLHPHFVGGQAEAQKPEVYLRPSCTQPSSPHAPAREFRCPSSRDRKLPHEGSKNRGRRERHGLRGPGASLPWFVSDAGTEGRGQRAVPQAAVHAEAQP